MSMNNLTVDGEFRYIINWFMEWSELQRDDFIPIVVDYITDRNAAAAPMVNANGLEHDAERSLEPNEKPMSLFQCRVKLFNQWNRKWPNEFKEKLQTKISEIDDAVGAKIKESLEIKCNGSENLTNGFAGSSEGHEYEHYLDMPSKSHHHHGNRNETKAVEQQQVVNDVMVVTNAVTLNDPMQEVLGNETSVDDIEPSDDTNEPGYNKENTTSVAHDDAVCNDDTSQPAGCAARLSDGNYNAGDQTRELVEQVVQMRNLQISEDGKDHEDVTASAAASASAQPRTTASSGPVTVTVNPVVVATTTQTLTTNAEVPLVV